MKVRVALALALLLLVATAALAQEQPQQPASPGMQPPKPAPEMERLTKQLEGTWNSEEKFEKSEFMPNGGTGKGKAVFKPGPGRLSLMMDYNSKGSMGSFHGFGTYWYDPKDQMFHSFWCDPFTPQGCMLTGTGKWEGDRLVMTGENEMMGKKYKFRQVISDITPNSFTYSEEAAVDGSEMKPTMTIKYRKAGSSSAKAKR